MGWFKPREYDEETSESIYSAKELRENPFLRFVKDEELGDEDEPAEPTPDISSG